MAVFRIERTRDYTVMSNHHLRDKALSLKSKGLLSMMLSLPEDWNYTTRGLAKICKEGVDAIGGALRELESAGYIVRHQMRDRQGRISDTEYVIYEQPQPKAPDTPQPDTALPDTENPYLDGPDTEKPAELNIEKSKTQKQTTDVPSTDSIPSGRKRRQAAGTERTGCDVGGRNAGVSGIGVGEHRVQPPVPGVYHLPRGFGRDDMDIIPSDLATYGNEAKKLLQDLQSRKTVLTGAYVPAVREVRRVRAAAPGLPLFSLPVSLQTLLKSE